MGVMIAAGITGAATLGGAFLQNWFSESAKQEAKRESRRSEALQIKFAREETAREQARFRENTKNQKEQFNRTYNLNARNQNLQENKFKFDATQQVIDRMVNMYDRSSVARRALSQSFRSRGKYNGNA